MTWGLEELDRFTKGMFGGELTVLAGEASAGKLMDVDELIPTPMGFVRNGDLEDGDDVFGEDGMTYKVIEANQFKKKSLIRSLLMTKTVPMFTRGTSGTHGQLLIGKRSSSKRQSFVLIEVVLRDHRS